MLKIDKESVELIYFNARSLTKKNSCIIWNIISDQIPDLLPNQIDYGLGWRMIDYSNIDSILDFFDTKDNLLFQRENGFQTKLAISQLGKGLGLKTMNFWVDEAFFTKKQQVNIFLDACIAMYDLLHPEFGLIHQTSDILEMATITGPKYKTITAINLNKGLPGVYWANFFGPKYVEKLDEHKLLLAPCHKTIKLSDGGILILISPSPLNPEKKENRIKQLDIKQHLGKQYFYNQN
jgi:hypothetical protein